MAVRGIFMLGVMFAMSSTAFAESAAPGQRDACRPDVRRFCHKLKEADGDTAFVECLRGNFDKLSKQCRTVLESNNR